MRPGRLRRWLLRGLLVAGSTVAAVAVAEALVVHRNLGGVLYYAETHRYIQEAIRLVPEADRPDGRMFENRPAVDLDLHGFAYRTDGAGLRVAEATAAPPPAKDPDVPRVLFLGDSVTLGWGVDDADTWIREAGRRLDAAGRPAELLNAGHLQYNTIQEVDWLRAHGPALAPDLVVLTFVVNDLDDAYGTYQALKAGAAAPADAPDLGARLAGGLRDLTPGLHALARLAGERAVAIDEVAALAPVDPTGFDAYAERAALTRLALDVLLAECAALGAELLLLDHSQPRLPVAEAWCAERGVAYRDLRFTAEEWVQDVRVSLADAHANALGNRYLADKATPALLELLGAE